MWLLLTLPGLVVLALVVYAIVILLGEREPLDLADFEQPDQPTFDRTQARYWKLGFYLNPQDPALFAPKRNPSLGTTINIGHPNGRLVAASILLGVALLISLAGGLPLLALR